MVLTAAACLCRWRQALPWCGLVWLSLAGAQGVQVGAAALLVPVPAPDAGGRTHLPDDKGARVGGSEAVVVMLTMRDPTTGSDTDYLCRTTRDRAATDALVVYADAAGDVSQSLCDSLWLAAPVLSNG